MRTPFAAAASLLALVCFVLVGWTVLSTPHNPHSPEWIAAYRAGELLPDYDNGLFSTAGACESCHGSDPDGLASVTALGEDVNIVDDWRASIMANSAKDPYWRAKMRQEMLNAPAHADETGHFCTKCHAPLGRHAHELIGQELYTFDYMLTDTAGLDGVSCVACHQQSTENLGNTHSGDLHFETDRIAYGPFESPLASPMVLFSGYTPVYSEHISDAGICAGCHTLITNTIDLGGNATGQTFVEQATYHEWLNSVYAEDELNVTCQACHMPDLGMKQPIVLAAGYDTPPRAPYSLHSFSGANVLMLEIMRDHRDTLGIVAGDDDFEQSIASTLDMLQNQSLHLEAQVVNRDANTLTLEVELENLAGHKFPSGYPARRLWVECKVQDATTNEILFHSGSFDDFGYINGEDQPFEPHYDVITNAGQVQIYEMVMANVEGEPTTMLEEAADYLKDNRLVPLGFSSTHQVYDTTRVVGLALEDANFNFDTEGNEGSGTDHLSYQVPLNGFTAPVDVEIRVWYLSIPPKWVDDLVETVDPFVAHFAEMYNEADKTPVLIDSVDLGVDAFVGVEEATASVAMRFLGGQQAIELSTEQAGVLRVYTSSGHLVVQREMAPGGRILPMTLAPGSYIASFSIGASVQTLRFIVL